MNLKDTLFMSHSNFSMKANLPLLEPKIQDFWNKNNIYQKVLNKNKNKFKRKTIFDGPPYANGNIHVGHALNKILKDVLVRFYSFNNYYSEFIMGWDMHGLPIENNIIKTNPDAKNWDYKLIRQKCKEYALSQLENQKKQFSLLGLFANNYKFYTTDDTQFIKKEIEYFFKLINDNKIYRSERPICWSWSSQTALAEAEIEYKTINTTSIYVKYQLVNKLYNKKTYLLIWTTTPWTLPANAAIAISKNFCYSVIEYKNENYIVSKNLAKNVFNNLNYTNIADIKSNELYGQDYYISNSNGMPIINKDLQRGATNQVIYGNHVNENSGTGLVHIAPFHGEDDFLLRSKIVNQNRLKPVVNKKGIMQNTQIYDGLFYLKANNQIISDLESNNLLFKKEDYTHEYPHDWRTNKPIFYLATKQWFIKLMINSEDKKELKKSFANVDFVPEWGKNRLFQMITNRDLWCISRQRKWGVPIISAFDKKGELIKFNNQEQSKIVNYFDKNSLDNWFDEKILHDLNKKNITLEKDILDVWFDSGLTSLINQQYFSVPYKNNELIFLEGSDQYRGWFNSSYILSFFINKTNPCSSIYTHGFVLDEKNIKMSKSTGNVVDPLKIIKSNGADILRLWACSSNYHSDISIGTNIINSTANVYRKIRNTFRFLFNNTHGIKYDHSFINNVIKGKKIVVGESFVLIDRYILNLLNDKLKLINKYYYSFDINKIIVLIEHFISSTISSFYLEKIKNIIYVDKRDDIKAISAQKTMFILMINLLKVLSPIIPHTCEEIFTMVKEDKNISDESIFLLEWTNKFNFSNKIQNEYLESKQFLKSVQPLILFAIAKSSPDNVNKNNQCFVKNQLETSLFFECSKLFISKYKKFIIDFYSYSHVEFFTNNSDSQAFLNICYDSRKDFEFKNKDFKIIVCKNKGSKCSRCWIFTLENNIYEFENLMLCKRCYDIVFDYENSK